MNKSSYLTKYLWILLLFFSLKLFAQSQTVTGIMTDFNGYTKSTTDSMKTANNSQNLLAFKTINNRYFTTGINDSIVYVKNPSLPNCGSGNTPNACISKKYFKSFPSRYLGQLTPRTNDNNGQNLIGIPTNYLNTGGVDTNDYRYYLGDGEKGLDISTAIFNISLKNGLITFENVAIAPESINDGIPDIIVTQTGQTSTTTDKYFFNNEAGQLVGSQYSVSFGGVSVVAQTNYVFYYVDTNLPDTARINKSLTFSGGGSRDLRVLALDWADMGITAANYQSIYSFNQLFNGASDVAFIAFNEESLFFKRNISGNIKEIDINANIKSPFPLGEAYVDLFLLKDNVLTPTTYTATVNSEGDYLFENVLSNRPTEVYRIIPRISPDYYTSANPFYVVENSDGTLNNYRNITLGSENKENINFVLGHFCIKPPLKTQTTGTSTPIAISTVNKQSKDWPNAIPNAFLVLDSKEKGLVLPRTKSNLIQDLTEGMIIYDTDDNCVKLYNGSKWICIERDCNEN